MVVALAIAVVALAALCAYLGLALARARGERHRFEAFLGQVMDADDASRRRIAQMLHDEVLLEVLDDGRGIEPGRREAALRDGHIGLASAVYRVEAAGGSLALTGGPGAGTRAVARLP